MRFTVKIEKAIRKASELHNGQARKADAKVPYISHVFSVAVILSNYTDDEDVIIAGLLHDTVEDTDYTPEELEMDFGPRVKAIVLGVTEQKTKDGIKISWAERKEQYLEKLSRDSRESLLVCAADRLHNLTCLLEEREKQGNLIWAKFNAPPDQQLEFCRKVLEILKQRLDNPLVEELEEAYDKFESLKV